MTYARAAEAVVSEYKQRIADYKNAEQAAFESDPAFLQNEQALRGMLLDKTRGKKTDEGKLAALKKENESMRAALGLVFPAPHCKICGDTGRHNGRFCDCVVRRASTGNDITLPLHLFDDVDFSVYGKDEATYKKLFKSVATICNTYPRNKRRCLVISGTTGNGKTYLAGCAAQAVLNRGMSVIAITAFDLVNRFLKYHTTFSEDKSSYLDPLLDCELLIVDDLGTESIFKNVTVEYLYLLLNERNLKGKLTMFTTNLTPDKILARYGERIYSRMFDKSLFYGIHLQAPDLRKSF